MAKGGNTDERDAPANDFDLSSIQICLDIIFPTGGALKGTVIKDLNLTALTKNGSPKGVVEVESCKIDQLFLNEFKPEGEVVFYDISPNVSTENPSLIELRKSNLDKVSFDNINFDQYSLVAFYRSRFAKATFTSCNFPKTGTSFEKFIAPRKVHYNHGLLLDYVDYYHAVPSNYYKDQYEIYLQLKNSIESIGNVYEAQKLQAISNDALRKIPDVASWDKAILWINRMSNNHGLSVRNPLIGFFGFSAAFYVLYLLSLGRIYIGGSFDPTLIGYYFSFVDITHRQDFLVEKGQLTGWAMAIDFLGKVIVGFFAYQFVAAFRKYGKR